MKHHSYGSKSKNKLRTCHTDVLRMAVLGLEFSPYDVTIVHGFRGKDLQNILFESGASTKVWPLSQHNNTANNDGVTPLSLAIDFAPFINGRVPWGDTHVFAIVAGAVLAAANNLDLNAVYGGDWDGDGSTKDQTLMDWGHIHIIL